MNQIVPFEYEGSTVRSLVIGGEPWFVAKDVCDVLQVTDHKQSTRGLDDDEKGVYSIHTLGGTQQVSIVNEPGLYSLILRSRKPEAKQFKRWITHEVLPTIRKTGVYLTPQRTEELLANPDLIIGLAQQVKQIRAERDEAIRTKALVAAGREGTMFSQLGVMSRENSTLKKKLGEHTDYKKAAAIPWVSEYFRAMDKGAWIVLGKALSGISETLGKPKKKIEDQRYGQVNVYHKSAIDELKRRLDSDKNYLMPWRKSSGI